MTRSIPAPMATASGDSVVRPALLAELDFASGFVRVNSTPYSLFVDGNEFLGVGSFGSVSAVEEGSELQAYGISMKLSGIPAALVSTALNEHYQGRNCTLYLALLDQSHQLVDAPMVLWRGRMDTMDITLGETAEIAVTAESRLVDWERPRIRRYTDEDQRAFYPGDKGFEFVPQMQQKEIVWGKG